VVLAAAKAAGSAVALPETCPLHQISRDVSRLHLGHIPGHHFAAPDIDHQVEGQPHSPHCARQKADVPRLLHPEEVNPQRVLHRILHADLEVLPHHHLLTLVVDCACAPG